MPDDISDLLSRMAALLPRKRLLACAPDVFERVRDQVQASPVRDWFEVVESAVLEPGQVISMDPAVLEPPPFEFEPWRPEFWCPSCTTSVPVPGLCVFCRPFAWSLFGPSQTTGTIALGGLADV